MQKVSKEYLDYTSLPFIPTPYTIYCLLEVINQEAQEQATTVKQNFEYYSGTDDVIFTKKKEVTNRYATAEENYVKIDGTSYFLPEEKENLEYYYNGIVLSPLSDEFGNIDCYLEINFRNRLSYDVKGFIFYFGECHPVDFNIEDMDGTILHEYRNNEEATLKTNDVFHFKGGLKLHILKLNKPYRRFKIEYMEFGMRVEFTNDDVITMDFNERIQLISTECYSSDLTLKCNNKDDEYNVENPSSTINFLEKLQKMQVYLRLEMPSGNIEQIKLADTNLNEWSSSQSELTLKCTDIFSFLEGQYYKGRYYQDGIDAFTLCSKIFDDAEIEKYEIDEYLKDIYFCNPVPNVKHKEAIQLICNATGCVFYQNRDGIPSISKANTMYSGMNVTNENYLDALPVGSKLEQVKQLEVCSSHFSASSDTKVEQLLKNTYTAGVQTVTFNDAIYDVMVTGANLLDAGAYFATFEVIEPGEVIVTGKKYSVAKQSTIFNLNDRGAVKAVDNPLISSPAMANLVGKWVSGYLRNDREYEFNYRGHAEYDVTDIVGLENKFTNDLKAQIYNHSLSFNGALRGSIKARKVKEWNG